MSELDEVQSQSSPKYIKSLLLIVSLLVARYLNQIILKTLFA